MPKEVLRQTINDIENYSSLGLTLTSVGKKKGRVVNRKSMSNSLNLT